MYVCMNQNCKCSISSYLNMRDQMATCRVRLRGLSAFEVTVMYELHVGSAMQQQNIKSALTGVKTEAVWSYRSSDTNQSDTMCADLVGPFSSGCCLKVIETGMVEKPSCCFTAITST